MARFQLGGAQFVVASRELADPVERYRLTRAEGAVCRLLIAGLSNARIAAERGTSTKTVANQAQSIFDKVGVRTRRELVHALSR